MEQCSPVAYLRSLQTADDVEGRVRMLVHLEENAAEKDSHQLASHETGQLYLDILI